MDANKRQVLIDIGYKIPPCCGTCAHFTSYVDPEFGDCGIHKYTHLKHSGGQRKLSVVQYGSCEDYKADDTSFLHGFKEFLTSPEE